MPGDQLVNALLWAARAQPRDATGAEQDLVVGINHFRRSPRLLSQHQFDAGHGLYASQPSLCGRSLGALKLRDWVMLRRGGDHCFEGFRCHLYMLWYTAKTGICHPKGQFVK